MTEKSREFYTVRGYALLKQDSNLTPSMEDYLEMAYRLGKTKGYTRMGDLAEALHVQPPSASKMVQKLSELGYFNYEKYGIIEFTAQGRDLGDYLLHRHHTIERFLTLIGVTQGVLEETEKIEHNLSEETLRRLELHVYFLEQSKEWLSFPSTLVSKKEP